MLIELFSYEATLPPIRKRLAEGDKVVDKYGNLYWMQRHNGKLAPEMLMPANKIFRMEELDNERIADGEGLIEWLREKRDGRTIFSRLYRPIVDNKLKGHE